MKKSILMFIFFPFIIMSQTWENALNFPESGRHHPITFSNDTYGFVVSGSYENDMYRFDKLNNLWTQLSDFPSVGRGYAYGVSYGDKAYMGFGSTNNGTYPNDWWEYDMNNDSWSQKSNFPGDGRNHPAMINVNDKIYVGCGSNNNGNLGDWWEYDITNDSKKKKSDIPGNERHHPFYFGIDNYAYVGFGHGTLPGPGSNSSGSYIYNDFYRYNPSNDSWIQLNNFPSESRVAGTQFSYNNKGYILSGDGNDHGPLDTGEFWEYDPISDLWNQLPSHPGEAIWAPGNFVIGCDVYFLLGQNNNPPTTTLPVAVYKYKLSSNCGCTDPTALNYSSVAIDDDGSCCYIDGCTDIQSINYDPYACIDNGSCIEAVLGCTNSTASNFNSQANVNIFNGGALVNSIGSGDYFAGNQHLIFNSNEECIIRSTDVYSENMNSVTFELRNNSGIVLDDTTYNLVQGKQNIILNFNVPIDNNLQLGISSANSGLYRNNSGTDYPYDIAGMIEIVSSSANQSGFYYFYYNIEVNAICNDVVNVEEFISTRKVSKIIDLLGREVNRKFNSPLIYIYDDGTVEQRIIIE